MVTTLIERPQPKDLGKVPTLVCKIREQDHHQCALQTNMDKAWTKTLEAFKLGPTAIKLINQCKGDYDAAEGELVMFTHKG